MPTTKPSGPDTAVFINIYVYIAYYVAFACMFVVAFMCPCMCFLLFGVPHVFEMTCSLPTDYLQAACW